MERPKVPAPRKWVVSPDDLLELSKTQVVRVVDARRSGLYARSHASGAVSLSLSRLMTWSGQIAQLPQKEYVDELMGGLGISYADRIVVYDDLKGQQASRAAWTLEHFGYTNVSVLDRDFSRLQRTDLTASAPPAQAAAPPRRESPDNLATREDLLSMLGDRDVVIIDCRDPTIFSLGHIAGALSLPWNTLAGHEKNFVGASEILIDIAKLHLEGKLVVLYCNSGLNSAHTYVALKEAGLMDVQLYAATYGEWFGSGSPTERGWQSSMTPRA
jgi:thiosulfate/3-mercaptopyruvate sulfurtransferase